jgi:hypothetical protein
MGKLKLFVFTEFERDYTDGLAFAIAHSEEEALKMIGEKQGFPVWSKGKVTVHRLDRRVAYAVSGGS